MTPTGALSEADPSAGFIIGGVSAGGNLSASLAQKWVDEAKTPHITGLWLSIPLIFYDHSHVPVEYKDAYLASEQNADADIINSTAIHWVNIHQSPDPKSPLFSPFNSEHPEKHVNLGKAGIRVYFQVAGADPLRDDGLIYERVLRKSGVETRIDVYPGVCLSLFFFSFLSFSFPLFVWRRTNSRRSRMLILPTSPSWMRLSARTRILSASSGGFFVRMNEWIYDFLDVYGRLVMIEDVVTFQSRTELSGIYRLTRYG